ncbi:MAG: EAL domain-containing protein [Acetobacteraceae bacterium]|nr:EAL domain-containing protein [Acetobacteraceae bacterium]
MPQGHACPSCGGGSRHPPGDPLTGLADRRGFHAALASMLAAGGEGPALLMVDLDRFKPVNDLLGHPVGDALLQAAARRLRSTVRGGDLCARLGGDEFAVLLASPTTADQAEALAARLVELLSRPYLIEGQLALIGASVGVAIAPADGATSEALISSADLALYAAKAAGRGTARRFEPAMRARAEHRRTLEQDLRAALALDQLELHFQPQIALEDNALSGFEALLRWRHPRRGLVRPDHFLPLAAEAGLMPAFGRWVLREACAAAATWPQPLRVAVNVAPLELEYGSLLRSVAAALAETTLSPWRLELEITETALLQPTEVVQAQLDGLRQMGVQISLDDFGTGFSSLTQLRRFPFDRIKIDRSFVGDPAVLSAIAGLGTALGMRTTAEGVETRRQLDEIRAGGCTDAQGYLLGRPMPGGEVSSWIERWNAGSGALLAPDPALAA